jgi:hypothetical protein
MKPVGFILFLSCRKVPQNLCTSLGKFTQMDIWVGSVNNSLFCYGHFKELKNRKKDE